MKSGILVVLVLASTQAFPQFVGPYQRKHEHGLGIIGGDNAYPNQFPYQVGIITSAGICGGSLVSKNFVLTAAHCLTYDDTVELVFGAYNISEKQEPSQIRMLSEELYRHEYYSSITMVNDIALILLKEPIEETEAIKIVPITNGSDLYIGKRGTISGWGSLKQDQIFNTDILKYITTPIISNEECGRAERSYVQFTGPNFMCTSGEGVVGACRFDSGGPLVVDGVQVGVVVNGFMFCEEGIPTVLTRLTEYKSWIAEHSDVKFQDL